MGHVLHCRTWRSVYENFETRPVKSSTPFARESALFSPCAAKPSPILCPMRNDLAGWREVICVVV